MRRTHNPLIALVQTLDDGIEFYRIAEQKSHSRALRSVFKRMADEREFALAYILPYIGQQDLDLNKSLTYHGTLANRYAPLLEDIIHDQDLTLVKQVEEHLVDAMISAATNTKDALVLIILKDLAPRVSRNYETCLMEIAGINASKASDALYRQTSAHTAAIA